MHCRFFCKKIAFLFLLISGKLSSQDGFTKAQLYQILSQQPADSLLIDVYNELCWPIYSFTNIDSSIYFGNKALDLSIKTRDLKRQSIAHRRIGITYINSSDFKKALFHQEKSLELSKKIGFKRGIQLALNNIGVIYLNNELLNKALGYFLQSLKIVEATNDYKTAANLYSNCGTIYRKIHELNKSKQCYLKANEFARLNKDTNNIIITNCELSATHRNLNSLDSAIFYLTKAQKNITNHMSQAAIFSIGINEGLVFSAKKDHRKALGTFIKTKNAVVNNALDKITLLINIADEYAALNQLDSALYIYNEAYNLSVTLKLYNNIVYLSHKIAEHYVSKNNIKKFAYFIGMHLAAKDSNLKVTTAQQIIAQQLEFDYTKRQIADSINYSQREKINNTQLELANTKLKTEKWFKLMLILIIVIVVVFSVFIYKRFRLTNRQKKIIEIQKQLVDEKNKELFDSINYAKRLQSAILPQLSYIKSAVNFDILYLPKDVIGGDFYFFEKHLNNLYIAVCDCTGHGIPGAIMSVVCHQALQKSITEFNLSEPDLILNKTREIIVASLNATQQNIKDGMDCSLIVINTHTKKIKWAGANNPLWLLQENLLTEIKADKQPVALYENNKPFTSHELNIKTNSFLYLFTDGFADQFGGIKGKKYKQKQLKEYLVSISDYSIEQQIELLQQNFVSWKGDHEQVDDVAIGIIKI